ncbi:methionine adenosyltransferase [Acrocarpospora catenulata]|uniref:methionine adenosyltransferase n=1 Tax=Acrocarpospora catenulata TaxID=2836182 RepID=UPI001BDACC7B|nr:methionine adenosyltransferase [Acrocarpospora catenulata]
MHVTTATGLPPADHGLELVERKGAGHPDTLADGVAEAVSRAYSRYCLEEFGAILHHNSDKTALLGGAAEVGFGHGALTAPITALINGRFTAAVGDTPILVEEIIDEAVRTHLAAALPLLDVHRDVMVRPRVTQASSPGGVAGDTDRQQAGRRFWFAPRSLDDLAERHRLFANDTSAGVGYAPLGVAELLALGIESHLSSETFRAAHPYYGTDIKLMVTRCGQQVHLTACVPQIARHTPDLDTYVARRDQMRKLIREAAGRIAPEYEVTVALNTRDDDARRELYLTATGSSLESGDEGVVGRGNRANGLISMLRPWSAEGVSGKNPVYHVGKLYNLAAAEAAQRLHELTGQACAVALVSQSGRDLADPWQVLVQHSGSGPIDSGLVTQVVGEVMDGLEELRAALLAGKLATA